MGPLRPPPFKCLGSTIGGQLLHALAHKVMSHQERGPVCPYNLRSHGTLSAKHGNICLKACWVYPFFGSLSPSLARRASIAWWASGEPSWNEPNHLSSGTMPSE